MTLLNGKACTVSYAGHKLSVSKAKFRLCRSQVHPPAKLGHRGYDVHLVWNTERPIWIQNKVYVWLSNLQVIAIEGIIKPLTIRRENDAPVNRTTEKFANLEKI